MNPKSFWIYVHHWMTALHLMYRQLNFQMAAVIYTCRNWSPFASYLTEAEAECIRFLIFVFFLILFFFDFVICVHVIFRNTYKFWLLTRMK